MPAIEIFFRPINWVFGIKIRIKKNHFAGGMVVKAANNLIYRLWVLHGIIKSAHIIRLLFTVVVSNFNADGLLKVFGLVIFRKDMVICFTDD